MANSVDFLDRGYVKAAESLSAIPDFQGWSEPVLATVAEQMADWCGSVEEAERLVRAAVIAMPKWAGLSALKAIWDDMSSAYDKQSWQPSYAPGAGYYGNQCKLCNDTGAVQPAGDLYADWSLCKCKHALTATTHVAALNAQVKRNRVARDARSSRKRTHAYGAEMQRVGEWLEHTEHTAKPHREPDRPGDVAATLNRAARGWRQDNAPAPGWQEGE